MQAALGAAGGRHRGLEPPAKVALESGPPSGSLELTQEQRWKESWSERENRHNTTDEQWDVGNAHDLRDPQI